MTIYHCLPTAIVLAYALLTAPLYAADSPFEGFVDPFLGEPKFDIQTLYSGGTEADQDTGGGRLPNVVVATDGTVVACYGATGGAGDWWGQGVLVRRSEDGGATWEAPITVANPGWHAGGLTVDETTGDILAFVENQYVGLHPDNIVMTIYRSSDHGQTWRAQSGTVIHPDINDNIPDMGFGGRGLTLRHGAHAGRLLRPAREYICGDSPDCYDQMYNTAVYSDDGGLTWFASEPFPALGTGEGSVAELSDGRIFYNSRRHWDPPHSTYDSTRRWTACSYDDGETWKDPAISVLPDGDTGSTGGTHGGTVRLPVTNRDLLLYSNCDSPTDRRNVSVWASFDGGKTWPLKRSIFAGPSAYSSLAAGRPGTASEGWIYCFFEAGDTYRHQGARVARFNLSWLLDGDRIGDGKLPQWIELPDGVIEVGRQKQLFVDDYVVADATNIKRKVGRGTKHGIVMKPTLPTDFQCGVVHEGPCGSNEYYEFGESTFCWHISPHWDPNQNKFRLWYMASKRPGSGLAYAESIDGINWIKPRVSNDGSSNLINWDSQVAFVGPSTRVDLLDVGLDGVNVTIDPSLPWGHAEKYKVGFYPNAGGSDCTTRLGYSADGINWSFYNNGFPVTGRAADSNNEITWNPITEKYLLLCRQDFEGSGGVGELRGVRIMEHAEGNDLINHPAAWRTLTTFVLDDPDKSMIPGTNTPVFQIHTFPIWYYEGVWFGMTDVLAATNTPVPEGEQDYDTRHEKGVWEFYMAPSRDGVNFDFSAAAYPRKPLIPRGPDGSFDKDCVRPPSNIITYNDEHWIYYLGTNERWGARKWEPFMGLAKLRLDGFFFLEANDDQGTVTTKPFVLDGNLLQVNVDASGGGRFYVEVLDQAGNPLTGFTSQDATVYSDVDALRLRPEWANNETLFPLMGQTIRLKFYLDNAKLYSFELIGDSVKTNQGESEQSAEDTPYNVDAAVIDLESTIPLDVKPFERKVLINSNRDYILYVPNHFSGADLRYTQHAHDNTSDLTVTAKSNGDIYLCLYGNTPKSLGLEGDWQEVGQAILNPPDDFPVLTFYKSTVKKGDRLDIKSDPQWGSVVIAKQIQLKHATNETLYNGISLPAHWPPHYNRNLRDPMPLPYLDKPPEVIPVDVGRQLFVDDFLIAKTNMKREFHQPTYYPNNPILKPDKPWENKSNGWFAAPFSGGVWFDPADHRFKMWYTGGFLASICYAVSKDGIHWEKPTFDVVEQDTNVVLKPVEEGTHSRLVDTQTIWLDHTTKDPKTRFKHFATERHEGWKMTYRTSPDGLHWSEPIASKSIWGDRSTVFYNPFRRVWVLSQRIHGKAIGRARSYSEESNPKQLVDTAPYNRRLNTDSKSVPWVAGEDLDPCHTDPRYKHIKPELYNLDAAPYESLMLGLFSIWQGPSNDDCNKDKLQKRNDILVGFSRDGFHWDRSNRERFISSSWDENNWRYGNVQSVGGGCLVVGDRLYFYFSGRAKPGSGRYDLDTNKAPADKWDADAATGLAILRRDGFASMNSNAANSFLTTPPVLFKGKYLFVNVDCPGGELRAEVLDKEGKVIEPYTAANCKPVCVDKTLTAVTWKGTDDLSTLAGNSVRFRFHLNNGKLYSFWVSPDKSGASFGYVAAGGPNFTGPMDTVGSMAYP